MKSSRHRLRHTLSWIRRFDGRYRRYLIAGAACTVGVVLLRLALPWPLRAVLEVAISETGGAGDGAGGNALDWLSRFGLAPGALGGASGQGDLFGVGGEVVALAASFVVMAVLLGYAEMQQRVLFKKYAAHTVHDLRAAAVDAANEAGRTEGDAADLVSRIVGDSARLKAELSGVLVHVSQNTLLFAGIVAVFVFLAPKLALLFLVGGLYAVAVGYYGNARVATVARKQREKEGRYASTLLDVHAHTDHARRLSATSARKDVQTTRLIMRSSWAVHAGLAVLTGVALVVSVRDVRAGAMQPGDLFLYLAYVLTVHRRMVHLGRQLARWGKVEAHIGRLSDLMGAPDTVQPNLPALRDALVLHDVRVGRSAKSGGVRRLKRMDLTIEAGSKVAVMGNGRSARSLFLRVLAGRELAKGTIEWDGNPVTVAQLARAQEIRYLAQTPIFGYERLGELLGVADATDLERDAERARALGIDVIVAAAPKGLDTRLASTNLNRVEARAVSLYEILRGAKGSLWILDDLLEGLSRKRAANWMNAVMQSAGGRTVILGLERVPLDAPFDRILLARGRQVVEEEHAGVGARDVDGFSDLGE